MENVKNMVLIDRLQAFFPVESWQWNDNEIVELEDISKAIHEGQPEEQDPFGDACLHMFPEKRSTKWHIGRIIYFINHPKEITGIELDNTCIDGYIYPDPVIVDGNHRFMAAMWLHDRGEMTTVECEYGGRLDLLDYLIGKVEKCPDNII